MEAKKYRLVMGFGTFDNLHPGHVFYLNELKKLGERLVVVIARDLNVERIKGKRPCFKEHQRKQSVESTGLPDEVILGHEKDFLKVLRDFQPDLLGFGYDQSVNMIDIKKYFPKIEMIRVPPYKPEQFKSSLIKSTRNIRK